MRLYPPRFRRDVGLGLVDAIEDRMRARRANGRSSLGVWIPALADTLRNAPVEWMATSKVRPNSDTTERARGGFGDPPSRADHPSRFGATSTPKATERGRTVIDTLMQDVRYARCASGGAAGFALVAILTLALALPTPRCSASSTPCCCGTAMPQRRRLVSVFAKTDLRRRAAVMLRCERFGAKRHDRRDQAVSRTEREPDGAARPQRLVALQPASSTHSESGARAAVHGRRAGT